jgi:photoactive yellow protein
MKPSVPPAFDTPDAAARLAGLSEAEFDQLPYGVVEMDHAATVRRYNTTESRFSGLSPSRVIGRHFFRDVAPCSNNRHVAQRYDQASLDETLAYTFSLRMRPVPVLLRMIKPEGGDLMFLLVQWN